MADIELVIKIPEGLKEDFESEQWTALSCMEMKIALRNGTPLPKGHGKLIDATILRRTFLVSARFNETWNLGKTRILNHIDNAQTIIEADTEGVTF